MLSTCLCYAKHLGDSRDSLSDSYGGSYYYACFVCVRSQQPTLCHQSPSPWNFPGKNWSG